MSTQVSDAEFLWTVAAFEPTTVREVSEPLPIGYQATLSRCRYFSGHLLNSDESSEPYTWTVSTVGRERVQAADLPKPTPARVTEYFKEIDRPIKFSPEQVATALYNSDKGWHTTPEIHASLSMSRSTVRRHLHELADAGAIEVDDSGTPYRWRLTDAGIERLSSNVSGDQ